MDTSSVCVGTGRAHEEAFNLKATELTLALPGTRIAPQQSHLHNKRVLRDIHAAGAPPPKAQIVGWPPVRTYRQNVLQEKNTTEWKKVPKSYYVKVCVDGAPFLRKIDLGVYKGYAELLKALEAMFELTIGDFSEREGYRKKGCCQYKPTYEDKDGDWMLVGDVPWEMFSLTCTRLRIKKQT
uniref:Auxin-responsive protein n=1 Tax=Kalanchoe fedtschenkoi TaxID=63787 RepID=A0A7N0USW4_KALFE